MHLSAILRRCLLTAWLIPLPLAVGAAEIQDPATIVERVEAFLRARLGGQGDGLAVQVQAPDRRLRLDACSRPLKAFLPRHAPRAGRVTVGVRCADGEPWTLYVPARVSLYAQVWVVRRDLNRGHRIGAGDLTLERRDLGRLPGGYLLAGESPLGQALRHRIARGRVLRPGDLEPATAVPRGARIDILARVGRVQVRMKGKALKPGHIGERIPVVNLSSGRKLDARVVSAGTVEVEL